MLLYITWRHSSSKNHFCVKLWIFLNDVPLSHYKLQHTCTVSTCIDIITIDYGLYPPTSQPSILGSITQGSISSNKSCARIGARELVPPLVPLVRAGLDYQRLGEDGIPSVILVDYPPGLCS